MPGKRWSDQEKNALRVALRDVDNVSDVQIEGRRANAIRMQAVRMGLIEPNAPRWNWSLTQRRRLKKYWRIGLRPEEIYDNNLLGEPHRSLWSIKKKWGRMKLSDRQRARKMRHKKIWKPGEKHDFDQYLLEHSATMTPEEIGEVWGVARSTVARWQTMLGVKRSREAVMLMDYSQAKQWRARRRIRVANRRSAEQRRAERQADLEEQAELLRRRCRHVEERVCTDCGRSWPQRAAFFHPTDKHCDFGTSRYFKHRCRFCENARRREQDQKKRARRHATERPLKRDKVAA